MQNANGDSGITDCGRQRDPYRNRGQMPLKSGDAIGFFIARRMFRRQLYAMIGRAVLTAALISTPTTTARLSAKVEPLPLPRFVSLKASTANLRVGPGAGYDVEWVFVRPGIPLEIYQQYGNWRRVRDWEGTSGWVHGSLLSGRRTGIVAPWSKDNVAMRRKPTVDSSITAWLAPRVEVKLKWCDGQWCAATSGPTNGFIKQVRLWGVYPGEML
jgi:SH3-like domain-containing protein